MHRPGRQLVRNCKSDDSKVIAHDMYLDCMSRMASECRCVLMGLWQIFPLKDPGGYQEFGDYLGEGKSAVFHLKGPPK